MSVSRCCCCGILHDTFPANIDNWTVVSGTVVHDTDHMELQSAGALAVTDETTTDDAYYVRFQLLLTESNKTFRIIVDYQDSDNYLFLQVEFLYTTGTSRLQLFRRSGGSDTSLGSAITTTSGPDVDELFFVLLCFDADGVLTGYLDGSTATIEAVTTSTGGDKVGIYLADTTDLEVHDVSWQRHKDEKSGCPECGAICNGCSGYWTATVSGIADGDCSNCNELLNGTFVLNQICSCYWRLPLNEADECENAVAEVTPSACAVPLDGPYYEVVVARTPFLFSIQFRYYDSSGTGRFVYQFQTSPAPALGDCDALFNGRTFTLVGGASSNCDHTSGSVSMVFTET